jgi:hypothetical protein
MSVPITLTGNGYAYGAAGNNTLTDVFFVTGAANQIQAQYGNLTVTGFSGDTQTQIDIGGVKVKDAITLDGANNVLDDSSISVPGDHSYVLSASTVTYTVKGTGGGNIVNLDNVGGTNKITLGGSNNTVNLSDAKSNTVTASGANENITVNGNATNNITTGTSTAALPNTVNVGFNDDDYFGYNSTVTLAGSSNAVNGGDENFVISGGVNKNTISLGDGNNNVSLTGTTNSVTVGGGNNSINAGGSNAVVNILGLDGTGVPDPIQDAPVPITATDFVTIAGTNDTVNAKVKSPNEFANVTILGGAVTSAATIWLGDGSNQITLAGTGGNSVIVGDGSNTILASGNGSTYNLGAGSNNVSLTGTGANNVFVTDPTGTGNDNINLNAGKGDVVQLDHAGGSIIGTGTGTTTVTQSGPNAVSVNLAGGIGLVTLGDGNDSVTANGNGSQIALGYGSDTVIANGKADSISLGVGNYTTNNVTANGAGDTLIQIGDGVHGFGSNNTVQATGGHDSNIVFNTTASTNNLTVGAFNTAVFNNGGGFVGGGAQNTVIGTTNNTVTFNDAPFLFGLGDHNTVTLGANSHVTFNSLASSTDTFSVGANSTVAQTNGLSVGTSNGAGDTFLLNGVGTGSTLDATGWGNETIKFGLDSSDKVGISTAASNDTFVVQADTAAGNYAGKIEIAGFSLGDVVDLQSLKGANGSALTSWSTVHSNITSAAGTSTLHLSGGGSVVFDSFTSFNTATSFAYTSGTGAVV